LPNANTIRRQVYGNQQLQLAALTNPGTTITAFQLNNNALTGQGGGVVPLQAGNYGVFEGQGQIIHVRANGTYSGATAGTTTLELELWEVPYSVIQAGGLTATSQTGFNPVANTSAVTLASQGDGNFSFDAYLQLDSNGTLTGSFEYSVDGTVVGPAHTQNITGLTGAPINGDTGYTTSATTAENDLNFVLTAVLGASTAGFVVTLTEFAIDVQ
jgi:hypothetical protein